MGFGIGLGVVRGMYGMGWKEWGRMIGGGGGVRG